MSSSCAMAVGMEVYNIAIKMGVDLQMGGFSSMTSAVFPAVLLEASYMGLFVFLFSNLYGNRVGASFAAKVTNPERGQSVFLPADAAGGYDCRYVPDHEHGGVHPVQCDPGRAAGSAASRYLGGDGHQEFSHGLFLEHVCRCTVYTVELWEAVPGKNACISSRRSSQELRR